MSVRGFGRSGGRFERRSESSDQIQGFEAKAIRVDSLGNFG